MSLFDLLIYNIIVPILVLLQIILIVYMIFSWLIAFNVINLRNPVMGQIYQLCASVVEPLLRPIRKVIPPLGGFDMAFLVLFLGITFLRQALTTGITGIF